MFQGTVAAVGQLLRIQEDVYPDALDEFGGVRTYRELLSNNHTTGQCGNYGFYAGTYNEKVASNVLQWIAFGVSVACLMFYAWAGFSKRVGWEEVYVAFIEMVKVIFELAAQFKAPSMWYLANNNYFLWVKYGEWLSTCPVILIHLSNLSGLNEHYSSRTMMLLVSDLGCIIWGITSAVSIGNLKIPFFIVAASYGCFTYYHAAQVFLETWHTVPKGKCRDLVTAMGAVFFSTWLMYPVLQIVGPEGTHAISFYGSQVAHQILDMVAKNMWGFMGYTLRNMIADHVALHGSFVEDVPGSATTVNVKATSHPFGNKVRSSQDSSASLILPPTADSLVTLVAKPTAAGLKAASLH